LEDQNPSKFTLNKKDKFVKLTLYSCTTNLAKVRYTTRNSALILCNLWSDSFVNKNRSILCTCHTKLIGFLRKSLSMFPMSILKKASTSDIVYISCMGSKFWDFTVWQPWKIKKKIAKSTISKKSWVVNKKLTQLLLLSWMITKLLKLRFHHGNTAK
jgi:hypothetical protein